MSSKHAQSVNNTRRPCLTYWPNP